MWADACGSWSHHPLFGEERKGIEKEKGEVGVRGGAQLQPDVRYPATLDGQEFFQLSQNDTLQPLFHVQSLHLKPCL